MKENVRNGSSVRDFLYNVKELNFGEASKVLRRNLAYNVYSLPINRNEEFLKFLEAKRKELEEEFDDRENISEGTVSKSDAIILYSLVRDREPEVIVETGVCNGLSTAVILKALEDNGKGNLYSIDLPQIEEEDEKELWEGKGQAGIPKGKSIGWIVEENLKDKWKLIEGDSNYRLPELLENQDEVDIFLHDSEHSYQTMMLEFSIAWRELRSGGLLLADDFDSNKALEHFADGESTEKCIAGRIGILEKNESSHR